MTLEISFIDLAIIIVYLGATIALGVWIGNRGKTSADYFLGNKELPFANSSGEFTSGVNAD